MIVQTEDDRYVRDTGSRALFSKREDLLKFRERRKKEIRMDNIDQRVSNLESEIEVMSTKLDKLIELLTGEK
jgi:predicted  nucleic acid-binding Zn-ribbon protein